MILGTDFGGRTPVVSCSLSLEKSYSPSMLKCAHDWGEWTEIIRRSLSCSSGVLATSIDHENTRAGLAAASRNGRRGGRPHAMDDEKTRLAEALLRGTENDPFVTDVIKQLKIGRTAFYRYFPPERIRALRPPHS